MKTPSFWKDKNLASLLLSPIGCLYMSATFLRLKLKKAKKVEKKVICIGNVTAGGTGKTPVSLAIAAMLQQIGKNPFFVSRGYGGKAQDILVDIKKDKAEVVGDEPLLLAQRAPVVINADRYKAAQKAIAFAGIGRPQKFYNSLKQCGVEIVETIDFPDHHQYSKDELENLILRAKEKKAQLYTTTKDYVKIPQELRPHFNVLQIKIKWQDEKSLETFLKEKL